MKIKLEKIPGKEKKKKTGKNTFLSIKKNFKYFLKSEKY